MIAAVYLATFSDAMLWTKMWEAYYAGHRRLEAAIRREIAARWADQVTR
jgi:hypothetical protein